MTPAPPAGLVCIALSLAALLLALASLYRARVASRQAAGARSRLELLAKEVKGIEEVIGKALEALDSMEEARRLKRKRRRRYVSALIVYHGRLPLDPREVQAAIEEAVKRLGGDLLLADARPLVVYYDPVRGALIIRTNHLAVNAVIAALLYVRRIGGTRVRIIPLRTAGTLSSAKRFLGVLEKIPSRAG